MSQKRRRVVAGLAALVAGTGAAYAVSGPAAVGSSTPSTASVTAVDFDWTMPGSTDYTETIVAGGSVTFSYPAGVSIHNVDFTGGARPRAPRPRAPPSARSRRGCPPR